MKKYGLLVLAKLRAKFGGLEEDYGIRPEDRALVGDNGFRPFAEI
jgi:hypothetical protein